MDKDITIGDKYDPAMVITEQAEADKYFESCVQHCMGFGKTRKEAESIEKQNLGYYAGYCGSETRDRVERLFHCAHPVFGKISVNGQPTVGQALLAGAQAAQEEPDD